MEKPPFVTGTATSGYQAPSAQGTHQTLYSDTAPASAPAASTVKPAAAAFARTDSWNPVFSPLAHNNDTLPSAYRPRFQAVSFGPNTKASPVTGLIL
jgi:hypothetical protein